MSFPNIPNITPTINIGTTQTGGTQGGPIVLMGIDAEDGGVGGHGPIVNYEDVVNSILSNVTNIGSGILVIGGGKQLAPPDQVTQFWNQISTDIGVAVTYVNGAAIATQPFAGFAMLAVVSDVTNTPSGGLTQAENDLLAARANDVAAFINGGGGLLGFSSLFTNPYAYLTTVGGGVTITNVDYSNIDPTPAGSAIGITDALDVSAWHQVFATFPTFLNVLAFRAGTTEPAAIGGQQVVVPVTPTTQPIEALLLASIAFEELSLAHIINAEAEKLQFVLGTLDTKTTLPFPVTVSNLLDVNNSVQRTLRAVIKKEMLLEFKFENILDLLDN